MSACICEPSADAWIEPQGYGYRPTSSRSSCRRRLTPLRGLSARIVGVAARSGSLKQVKTQEASNITIKPKTTRSRASTAAGAEGETVQSMRIRRRPFALKPQEERGEARRSNSARVKKSVRCLRPFP